MPPPPGPNKVNEWTMDQKGLKTDEPSLHNIVIIWAELPKNATFFQRCDKMVDICLKSIINVTLCFGPSKGPSSLLYS